MQILPVFFLEFKAKKPFLHLGKGTCVQWWGSEICAWNILGNTTSRCLAQLNSRERIWCKKTDESCNVVEGNCRDWIEDRIWLLPLNIHEAKHDMETVSVKCTPQNQHAREPEQLHLSLFHCWCLSLHTVITFSIKSCVQLWVSIYF